MKIEQEWGYHIGFGVGQDDQKAKKDQTDIPAVPVSAPAIANTNPEVKTLEIT